MSLRHTFSQSADQRHQFETSQAAINENLFDNQFFFSMRRKFWQNRSQSVAIGHPVAVLVKIGHGLSGLIRLVINPRFKWTSNLKIAKQWNLWTLSAIIFWTYRASSFSFVFQQDQKLAAFSFCSSDKFRDSWFEQQFGRYYFNRTVFKLKTFTPESRNQFNSSHWRKSGFKFGTVKSAEFIR